MILHNPLLPGFYPDPSVCLKGDDYYLITSSFEFFPGIPIFHSKDFVHWHQIGYVLDRPSQLSLDGLKPSKGIYASTIRYKEDEDLFYVVTTLVTNTFYTGNVNFYVTTKDPAGPWSEPVVIHGAESIDPTLVFDGNKTYYLGNLRPHLDNPANEERWIWIQEMDLKSGSLIGERQVLRKRGANDGADAPEGPHMYHIGDYYYLMIAEGGTNMNHSETIFRSKNILGPFEPNPRNPLITHRNLTRRYPINSTGHADLIQLANGEWWAVLLASRLDGGTYRVLGRETFAVPVIWEEGWPVFSPDTGHVEFECKGPNLPSHPWPAEPVRDDFDTPTLRYCWNYLRTPRHEICSLTARPGWLRLFVFPATVAEMSNPSFVGRRMQHKACQARCLMEFDPREGECAGMTLFFNHAWNFQLLRETGRISLSQTKQGKTEMIAFQPYTNRRVFLKIVTREAEASFWFSEDNFGWIQLGSWMDIRMLSMEVAGGFTGTYIALYATSNGRESCSYADFDWFDYQPIGEEQDNTTLQAMRQ